MKDDLDDFEITPPSSPTADEKALLKVKMIRSRKQADMDSGKITNPAVKSLMRRPGAKQCVLTRQPAGGFITVTDQQDGRRVYLNKTNKVTADKEVGIV